MQMVPSAVHPISQYILTGLHRSVKMENVQCNVEIEGKVSLSEVLQGKENWK